MKTVKDVQDWNKHFISNLSPWMATKYKYYAREIPFCREVITNYFFLFDCTIKDSENFEENCDHCSIKVERLVKVKNNINFLIVFLTEKQTKQKRTQSH